MSSRWFGTTSASRLMLGRALAAAAPVTAARTGQGGAFACAAEFVDDAATVNFIVPSSIYTGCAALVGDAIGVASASVAVTIQ